MVSDTGPGLALVPAGAAAGANPCPSLLPTREGQGGQEGWGGPTRDEGLTGEFTGPAIEAGSS